MAQGYYCSWLWDSLTVLCDGKVTCGLDDPWGVRSLGDANRQTIREVFNGPAVSALRQQLLGGERCQPCSLYTPITPQNAPGIPSIPHFPRRLVLETTIRCNIRCRNASCDVNNDRGSGVRKAEFLPWDTFTKVLDDAGPHLEGLYFFNYGEPFLHPRALDMLAYARAKNPRMKIVTTTNGIPLDSEEKARRIVGEQLVDWINFSIAGTDQDTYFQYHQAGRVDRALNAMRRLVDEKRRVGAERPRVRWRYLLFNWNDSDAQIAAAKAMAKDIGVDEFTFFLCSAPLDARSTRRAPGRPGFEAIKDFIDYEFHYQPDPFADVGIYHPEGAADLGEFSWTSRRSTVQARVTRGVAKVLLAGIELPRYPWPTVQLRSPFGTRKVKVNDASWQEVRFTAPAGYEGSTVPVTIEVDETFIPFRHGLTPDVRELGVRLSLATIERPHAQQPLPRAPRRARAHKPVIPIRREA